MSITLTKSGWTSVSAVVCLLILPLIGTGQVVRSATFELPAGAQASDSYHVISAGENGVVLYRRSVTEDGRVGMDITRLDSTLNQSWKGFVPIERNLAVEHATLFHNIIFLLLREPLRGAGGFEVLAIDTEKKGFVPYKINNAIPFVAKYFMVTEKAVLIGGYFNYRPLVLHFSFESKQARILPGILNEVGELEQLKVYDNGAVDVIVAARNVERRKCLWIRNYDADGNLIKTILLDPGPSKNFIFGQSVKTEGDEQVVAGVYGRNQEYSRGVFLAHINLYGEYQVNYYNFGDLQHFFNFMTAKREKRVMQRIERRKIKGKKIKFNYRFLVHSLIPYQNQYLLIGEAFYPTYHSVGDAFSKAIVFDGYKYTHAVVLGLSKNGKLLWDNSFEINDVKSYDLQEFVKISPQDNHILLLYLFNNTIQTKIIEDYQVMNGKSDEPVPSRSKKNEKRRNDIEWSQLEHWYKGNFYAYGVRRIKDPASEDLPARRIFFVHKVAYR